MLSLSQILFALYLQNKGVFKNHHRPNIHRIEVIPLIFVASLPNSCCYELLVKIFELHNFFGNVKDSRSTIKTIIETLLKTCKQYMYLNQHIATTKNFLKYSRPKQLHKFKKIIFQHRGGHNHYYRICKTIYRVILDFTL